MQKHSDRPDKRLSNNGSAAGNGATGASAANATSQSQSQNAAAQSQIASAAAAAAAAGLTGMPVSQGNQLTSPYSDWPTKMDPTAYAARMHETDYGSLMDPRLQDPRHQMEMERVHSQFGGNPGYDHSGANVKTSSAFSPIQNSIMQQASAATAGYLGGPRGAYPFYDHSLFPKPHSQVLNYAVSPCSWPAPLVDPVSFSRKTLGSPHGADHEATTRKNFAKPNST